MAVAISIGPVPSASVLAWAATARHTIEAIRARPELGVPADVAGHYARYVEEWTGMRFAVLKQAIRPPAPPTD